MTRAGWAAILMALGGILATSRFPVVRSRLSWDGRTYQTTGGAPACLTADRYRQFSSYRAAKEDRLMTAMLDQGVCVLLKPGIEVQPVRRVGWWLDDHRLVSVRVSGTRQTMVLDERLGLAALEPSPKR